MGRQKRGLLNRWVESVTSSLRGGRSSLNVALLLPCCVACTELDSPNDRAPITPAETLGGRALRPLPSPMADAAMPVPSSDLGDISVVQQLDASGPLGPSRVDAGASPARPSDAGDLSTRAARFVRLVAESEVSGGPNACIADFNLVGESSELLPRVGWVASADDAELIFAGGAPAEQAIDPDRDSLWHTSWFGLLEQPGHPHYLQLDLQEPQVLIGFRYRPRQDQSTGRISAYRFFMSNDGKEWGEPVVSGVFPNSATEQEVRFAR